MRFVFDMFLDGILILLILWYLCLITFWLYY